LRRLVAALPWASREPLGEAPHALIRSGRATLVRNADDVLELMGRKAPESGVSLGNGEEKFPTGNTASRRLAPNVAIPLHLTPIEAALYRALRERPLPLDHLASAASLTASDLSIALLARELARRSFIQIGRSFMEFLAMPRLGPRGILDRVELIGYEPMLARAHEGKGAVMVTAHYGNWELLGAAVRARGGPVRYVLPPQ